MIRGTKTFKCDKCGEVFRGLDIEWNATPFSAPVHCPNCGNMTNKSPSLFERVSSFFK